MELMGKIWKYNRVHVSSEMREAFERVFEYYSGSEFIEYPSGKKFGPLGSWVIPDKWVVHDGVLKDKLGHIIANFKENPLRLFAYSSPFEGKISRQELLDNHVSTMPNRPDALSFNFRNQFRPWDRRWGFSLTQNEADLLEDEDYFVSIKTEFVSDQMTQLEYGTIGEVEDRFLFVGHFDHPAMCNDGLSGCIAAMEVIKRLREKKTYYSYSSLLSVEIIGSVAYCEFEPERVQKTLGACFVAMSSSPTPLSYQNSSDPENFIVDRAMHNLLKFRYEDTNIQEFRHLVGNDEIAFDVPGISINCGSITRWPYPEYHSSDDNIDKVEPEMIEEKVQLILDMVDIIETNFYIEPNFSGLPCLSNPLLDLYIHPTMISQVQASRSIQPRFTAGLTGNELKYLQKSRDKLNAFMNNLVPFFSRKGKAISILDVASKFSLPYRFVSNYLGEWEKKGLIKYTSRQV